MSRKSPNLGISSWFYVLLKCFYYGTNCIIFLRIYHLWIVHSDTKKILYIFVDYASFKHILRFLTWWNYRTLIKCKTANIFLIETCLQSLTLLEVWEFLRLRECCVFYNLKLMSILTWTFENSYVLGNSCFFVPRIMHK